MVSLAQARRTIADRPGRILRSHDGRLSSVTLLREPPQRYSREDRIRAVFKLTRDDALPEVDRQSLQTYHQYLAARLSFPFPADYCEETEPLVFDHAVTVTGLPSAGKDPLDSSCGILCTAVRQGREFQPPLAVLKVADHGANRRLIDDYWHWFWQCR